MEKAEALQALSSALPENPLIGVGTVAESMHRVRRTFSAAELGHLEPFAAVYNGVTDDIHTNITQLASGDSARFKDEVSLHRATGVFSYHFSKQISLHLEGKPVEKHWAPLFEDERARKVDRGTQLCLGMIAHIGGDLARTVDETGASNEYIQQDYPRVDMVLRHRAYKVANLFVPGGNKAITDKAMDYVIHGRKAALKDYYRMQGKSDDEKQAIIHASHERTAVHANRLLSYAHKGRFLLRIVTPHYKDLDPSLQAIA